MHFSKSLRFCHVYSAQVYLFLSLSLSLSLSLCLSHSRSKGRARRRTCVPARNRIPSLSTSLLLLFSSLLVPASSLAIAFTRTGGGVRNLCARAPLARCMRALHIDVVCLCSLSTLPLSRVLSISLTCSVLTIFACGCNCRKTV